MRPLDGPDTQAPIISVRRHLCIAPFNKLNKKVDPPVWVTDETGKDGEGPQYYVDANGTVFTLVGEFDLGDEPRMTIHTETINATSIGIEMETRAMGAFVRQTIIRQVHIGFG